MRFALAVLFILLSPLAFSSPAEERPVHSIPILDTAKELLGTRINMAADKLDSFFATERADDEFGRSQLRIRTRFNLLDKEPSISRTQYRLNLKLPHLQKKFDPSQFKKNRDKESEDSSPKEDKGFFSGWIFNSDISANASIPPRLIFRSRVRNDFKTGTLKHYFMEQVTYTTDASGFVNEISLESDHVYSDRFIFRFINTFEWQITQKIFETHQGPTWLFQATEDDGFNYGFLTHSLIDAGPWHVNSYEFFTSYRRNLYQQWVYLDIRPGLSYQKKWDFIPTPYLNLQLEMLFGGD